MFLFTPNVTHSALFVCLATVAITHCSDKRGISYCAHNPTNAYVCEMCIGRLQEESPECVCGVNERLLKNTPNPACPYHYRKYLTWLEEESSTDELPTTITPIPAEAYELPSSTQLRKSLRSLRTQEETSEEEIVDTPEQIYIGRGSPSSTSVSTSYKSLSSSNPPATSSPERLSSSQGRKTFREKLRDLTRERSAERSVDKKRAAASAPTSLRTSAEKRVQFEDEPTELEKPVVMRREEQSKKQKSSAKKQKRVRSREKEQGYYSE